MLWHEAAPKAIQEELKTDFANGLTTGESRRRLEEHGRNQLDERPPVKWWVRFFTQLKDTMVLILIAAALISCGVNLYDHFVNAHPFEWVEPAVILLIVLLNALMGVLQESKAEAALAALKKMSSPTARVIRDGMLQTVDALELVPGDIVDFEAGDVVPADCRLLRTSSLFSDESSLTGESVPAEKDAAFVPDNLATVGDRRNMAYAGCAVSAGNGRGVVVETGMTTEMGKIASMLEGETKEITPLQKKLADLGKYLGVLALIICAVVFLVGLLFDKIGLLTIFMTAVSLAVAAIPEGLPAIVTIVLAIGVQRMVKRHAIIRRLPAVETLGSATVICSDKTGTLTQNRMTLVKIFTGGTMIDATADDLPEMAYDLLRMGALCTDGDVVLKDGKEQVIGDPTEGAIISCAMHHKMDKAFLQAQFPRLGEIPFDSDRKLMTSINMIGKQHIAIVKGAPDILLPLCGGDHKAVLAANEEMGRSALRVLAIAFKVIPSDDTNYSVERMETGLTFAGLVGMIDPPRTEVIASIKDCTTAGIRTVMITGDHIATASAIARQLGILNDDSEAISGEQLAALSDDELFAHIRDYRVYARVTPQDKIRIVKAWQRAGEIVAMTGDGVNDAPALKAADIGCAMGITGTDVAKNAADMTLMDDNFSTIVSAVREGRGIYDNICKSVHYLLSCNIGEIITVLLCMLLWKLSPLAPIQLLWLNLVTDSLPALALGMEPAERDIMRRPPRVKSDSIFSGGLGFWVIVQGAMIGILTLIAFHIGQHVLPGQLLGGTMAFAVLALAQLVHAFNTRSTHSLFRIGLHSNWYMVGAFAASLLLVLLVLTVPVFRAIFELQPLTAAAWKWVVGLSLVPLVLSELMKAIRAFSRRLKQNGR